MQEKTTEKITETTLPDIKRPNVSSVASKYIKYTALF
jgi:hypothetical protein